VPVPAVVVAWVAVVLGLDTGATLTGQRLLGLVTWALLLWLLRAESSATRAQVAVVVVFASVVEYVFAGWLGVYVYRLENVPWFVPPGHGLVYLAALAIGRSAWAHRSTWLQPLTLAVCGGWAVWGLTLSPTLDVLGAFWFVCLLALSRYGTSQLVYAGAFLVVSYLEVVGTSLGTWTWQPHDPTGLVAIGNPPSGIAGGYAWFDAAALVLTPRLIAWRQRTSERQVVEPAGGSQLALPQTGEHLVVQQPVAAHAAAAVGPGPPVEVGEAPARLLDDDLQRGEVPQRHLGLERRVDCPLGDEHVRPEVAEGPGAPAVA
jgi:hypothetical protein